MVRFDTIRYDTIRYDTIRYDTLEISDKNGLPIVCFAKAFLKIFTELLKITEKIMNLSLYRYRPVTVPVNEKRILNLRKKR
jgi:hypothetical protein